MHLIITSLLTHTQVDTAETCTKIFSMKRRFYQYTFYLLKIAAYYAQTNVHFKQKHLNTKIINRFFNSTSSKESYGTQGFKIGLSIKWIWPLENLSKFFLK